MVEWITPIFDRTQADVSFAIAKIEEWRERGSTDIYELKGCLNVSDINRIENDIQYLSDNLSRLYYFPHTISKEWGTSGLPDESDINRIIGNVRNIISAYAQLGSAPEVPDTMLTFEQINNIEENLYLVKEILESMIPSFRSCGTFECGEEY